MDIIAGAVLLLIPHIGISRIVMMFVLLIIIKALIFIKDPLSILDIIILLIAGFYPIVSLYFIFKGLYSLA